MFINSYGNNNQDDRTSFETIDKLRVDDKREHLYLHEREENIRLLKLDIKQRKQLPDNINHNQDEYNSLLKQQKHFSYYLIMFYLEFVKNYFLHQLQ